MKNYFSMGNKLIRRSPIELVETDSVSESSPTNRYAALIKRFAIDTSPRLGPKYVCALEWKNSKSIGPFLALAKNVKLPYIKGLDFQNVQELSCKDTENLDQLLQNSLPEELVTFRIKGGDQYFKLDDYKQSLQNVFDVTQHSVGITWFTLDDSSLKFIVENAHTLTHLVLDWCRFKISNLLAFDCDKDYNMVHLSLRFSWRKSDPRRLNENKLQIFLRALSKTTIRHSLKFVYVNDDWFNCKEVKQIFNQYLFNVTVKDEEWHRI